MELTSFAQAFALLATIADERGDSVSLKVETWRHNDGWGRRSTIEWSVYSCGRNEHYTGRTAAEAIERYRDDQAAGPGPATPDALENVGAPDCAGADMMPLEPDAGESP